ncbi:DUF3040 domain-containing protein [Kibdelosporangium philippinense]|uniref:DUF3040 domain-containing protein n=1 Tax=Kibdelosporangium philippinense TaxID=211113 RepID=A0ABS8Z570_9PSEU|nr:DUF3040 domain-containing protein [Kibdelosporangium philippinense]MCE7003053.1 DUF3040 domain-containing protein [Kibdelosporangium philippinense]
MKRREQRALRAIEKSLNADDPGLTRLFRSFGGGGRGRMHWYALPLALLLIFLGVSVGIGILILTGVVLLLVVILKWTARESR